MSSPELLVWRSRVDAVLESALAGESDDPALLHSAMRYALLGGGKRLRPLLVFASGAAVGVDCDLLDQAAAAVEMVHAHSLVHDDLPSMDDDDLRRGCPACHKAFDEATAIIAGNALLALAFGVLEQGDLPPEQRLEMLRMLSRACGSEGMAGGQVMDLQATGHPLSIDALEAMHQRKTGALLRACVRMGAVPARLDRIEVLHLEQYAAAVGLAFQVKDDILDVEGETSRIGKISGSDEARRKSTFVTVFGLAAAKERLEHLHREALANLEIFGEAADSLRDITEIIVQRDT